MLTAPITLWPICVALLLWTALSVYVFIKAPVSYYLRWTLIPASFVAVFVVFTTLTASLGYAVDRTLPPKFEFLGYRVILSGVKKSAIEVWVAGKHTRLYVIPYTKEAEKAFKEAEAKKKQGGQNGAVVMGGKKGKGKPGEAEEPYESNLLLPHQITPKVDEPAEEPEAPVEPVAPPKGLTST